MQISAGVITKLRWPRFLPLPGEDRAIPFYSHLFEGNPLYLRPRSRHQFSRSSFSSMISGSSAHRHPLCSQVSRMARGGKLHLQMLSLYLHTMSAQVIICMDPDKFCKRYIPIMVDSLDYEAQSWTHGVHVLFHDPFDDGGFPCIV